MCCSGHFVETCLAHASCGFGETCKLFFGNTCDNSCSNPFLMSATSSHHESEGKKQKIFGACMLRHHDIQRKAVRCREPYSHTKDIIRFLRQHTIETTTIAVSPMVRPVCLSALQNVSTSCKSQAIPDVKTAWLRRATRPENSMDKTLAC